jgi:hypothetical protein
MGKRDDLLAQAEKYKEMTDAAGRLRPAEVSFKLENGNDVGTLAYSPEDDIATLSVPGGKARIPGGLLGGLRQALDNLLS